MIYNFVNSNDKILTQKIEASKRLTKQQKIQLKSMKETLLATPEAAAISANQLGISGLRAFVCRNGQEITAIVNPKLTWTSVDNSEEIIQEDNKVVKKSFSKWERCLSFPGKEYLVDRPYAIKLEFMNEKEVYKSIRFKDEWARLFCHEINHLDGIRLIDIAEDSRDITEESVDGDEQEKREASN